MTARAPQSQPANAPLPHTQTPWHVDSIEKDVIACRGGHIARCERRGPKPYGKMQPETIGNAAFIVEAVNNHDALMATIEKLTKDLAFAKDYVGRALASYEGDPANNDFQQGFQSALQVVLDEAFTPQPKSPTRTDQAFPEDSLYFCPGGYYIGSFVCKSCECPKGHSVPLEDQK